MRVSVGGWGAAGLILTAATIAPVGSAPQAPAATEQPRTQTEEVPGDLKPLLRARGSELRLVVDRYTADRATLNGNYDGAPRGRGGRGGRGGAGAGGGRVGGADAPPAPLQLSPHRIARLARFDLDWQAALSALDRGGLTPAARRDLDGLTSTIAANLAQLGAETQVIAEVSPFVPFASSILDLSEARIRLEDVDAPRAAGVLTSLTKEVARVRGGFESGGSGAAAPGRAAVVRGADAVAALRASLATWFAFYDGYDPVFTWWMGMPYEQANRALTGYEAFLRDTVAPSAAARGAEAPAAAPIAPATPPRLAEVPDLREIIALPQDEMTDIVQRFLGPAAVGGRGGTNRPGAGRPRVYYEHWLAALRSLDFDRLSRNAQVDYLFIRSTAERQIARLDFVADPNPPRKPDDTGIAGEARGRRGLILDLGDEMIPYTPEQLIGLAEQEFAWCEEEMKKASREMGFGDDWKQAVEQVKEMHVPPGQQPAAIRDMLFEAVDYLRAKDLITVPEIASESLHMSMMSPEAQLANPFFLGGSQIIVSYPTNTMEYDARLQSMRGNNLPFSHATAFHEMIPGHNLVAFMGARYASYRASFRSSTPFFGEGWPLYWELTLYDMGFQDTPEKRVGALFWRMHRCARIIFSLRFHMGQWSPKECIDFLVARVGHERDNATAEVRRSFQGGYGPLYQAAYLLGGLQLRGLRRELVDSGVMTNKAFHDEILRQGSMPVALVRLALTQETLTRDMPVEWKFYGDMTVPRL